MRGHASSNSRQSAMPPANEVPRKIEMVRGHATAY
jgi:hypothetical protein